MSAQILPWLPSCRITYTTWTIMREPLLFLPNSIIANGFCSLAGLLAVPCWTNYTWFLCSPNTVSATQSNLWKRQVSVGGECATLMSTATQSKEEINHWGGFALIFPLRIERYAVVWGAGRLGGFVVPSGDIIESTAALSREEATTETPQHNYPTLIFSFVSGLFPDHKFLLSFLLSGLERRETVHAKDISFPRFCLWTCRL